MKTCDHGIALIEDWCSQCKGAPSVKKVNTDDDLRREGYDDATTNKDVKIDPTKTYLQGYQQGLEAVLRWSQRNLDGFNDRYTLE